MLRKHEELEQIPHRGIDGLRSQGNRSLIEHCCVYSLLNMSLKHQEIEQTPHRAMLYIFLLEDVPKLWLLWLAGRTIGKTKKTKHTKEPLENNSKTIEKTKKN